jgi:hypothetical protein
MHDTDNQLSPLGVIQIRICAAFASCLISLCIIFFDDIINQDGILYIQVAELFLTEGFQSSAALYHWPAYSIIIAYFHQLTSISLESSALIVNSFFFVLLTDALVLICRLIMSTHRQLAISALLITCFMPLNEYRDYIFRDIGYWAFTSLALYQFMLFLKSPNLRNASLWQIFMIAAIFFRIEGSVILLTLPLFLLLIKTKKNLMVFKEILLTSYLSIIGMLAISVVLLSHLDVVAAYSKLNGVPILTYIDLSFYTEKLTHATGIIESQILNKYSKDYATFIFLTGMLLMLILKLFEGFSFSYIIVYFMVASKSDQTSAKLYQQLFMYFFLVNILILIFFLYKEYFVSSRYLVMTLIGLFLFLVHRLVLGIEFLWLGKRILPLSIISLCLLYNLIDALTMSYRKSYIKDIAIWSAQNIPNKSLLMTDSIYVKYYFDTEKSSSILCQKNIETIVNLEQKHGRKLSGAIDPCAVNSSVSYLHFDYVILVEKKYSETIKKSMKKLKLQKMHHTSDTKGNRANIYRVIKM